MVASTVWAQVFQVGPGLTPELDTNVVQSAEVVSLNPQTVVYQIAPRAVWSDGVPITAADFQYAWQSQRGGAIDVDGTPDSVASTLGYRDIVSVVGSSNGGQDRHRVVPHAVARTGSRCSTTCCRPTSPRGGLEPRVRPVQPRRARVGRALADRDVDARLGDRRWGATRGGGGARPVWTGSCCEAVTDPTSLASRRSGSAASRWPYPSGFDQSLMAQAVVLAGDRVRRSHLGTTMLQLDFNVRHAPLDSWPRSARASPTPSTAPAS